MLIICPECELQVSDKAFVCPHCGNPMKKEAAIFKPRNKNKRKRLPNGFGQITELKGRYLRKPFRAMVSTGKDEKGRPICKLLKPDAYFKTYNEAYEALVEYNKNPCTLEKTLTLNELFDKWIIAYEKSVELKEGSPNPIKSSKLAWQYCSTLYQVRVVDARPMILKNCVENAFKTIGNESKDASPSIKTRIKTTLNKMFDYAVEYDMIDKNPARAFTLPEYITKQVEDNRTPHSPYSKEEITKLWDHADDMIYVDVLLFQCYSGFRPQELGLIKMEDVHLDERYIVGGIKSEAGTDRIVPIHPLIRPFVERFYETAKSLNSEYLINAIGRKTKSDSIFFNYEKCNYAFNKIYKELEFDSGHKPHDGRLYFTTLAKKYEMDEYAVKYIVGHSIRDITEKIYTRRETSWLISEMEKIKDKM